MHSPGVDSVTPGHRLSAPALGWAAVSLLIGASSATAAADPIVRVAVASTDREALSAVLRDEVERAPDLTLVEDAAGADLVLRGSVTRMEHAERHDSHEVRCEVSLIVAEAEIGAIRATLRGRAGAASRARHARLERDAMRGAVRGALRPLGSVADSLMRGRRPERHRH